MVLGKLRDKLKKVSDRSENAPDSTPIRRVPPDSVPGRVPAQRQPPYARRIAPGSVPGRVPVRRIPQGSVPVRASQPSYRSSVRRVAYGSPVRRVADNRFGAERPARQPSQVPVRRIPPGGRSGGVPVRSNVAAYQNPAAVRKTASGNVPVRRPNPRQSQYVRRVAPGGGVPVRTPVNRPARPVAGQAVPDSGLGISPAKSASGSRFAGLRDKFEDVFDVVKDKFQDFLDMFDGVRDRFGNFQYVPDFLRSYWWALVVVLGVAGLIFVLSYSDVVDVPEAFSEECRFPISVECRDYSVKSDSIELRLENVAGKNMIVKNIKATSDSGTCELAPDQRDRRLKKDGKLSFNLNVTPIVGLSAEGPSYGINGWNLMADNVILVRADDHIRPTSASVNCMAGGATEDHLSSVSDRRLREMLRHYTDLVVQSAVDNSNTPTGFIAYDNAESKASEITKGVLTVLEDIHIYASQQADSTSTVPVSRQEILRKADQAVSSFGRNTLERHFASVVKNKAARSSSGVNDFISDSETEANAIIRKVDDAVSKISKAASTKADKTATVQEIRDHIRNFVDDQNNFIRNTENVDISSHCDDYWYLERATGYPMADYVANAFLDTFNEASDFDDALSAASKKKDKFSKGIRLLLSSANAIECTGLYCQLNGVVSNNPDAEPAQLVKLLKTKINSWTFGVSDGNLGSKKLGKTYLRIASTAIEGSNINEIQRSIPCSTAFLSNVPSDYAGLSVITEIRSYDDFEISNDAVDPDSIIREVQAKARSYRSDSDLTPVADKFLEVLSRNYGSPGEVVRQVEATGEQIKQAVREGANSMPGPEDAYTSNAPSNQEILNLVKAKIEADYRNHVGYRAAKFVSENVRTSGSFVDDLEAKNSEIFSAVDSAVKAVSDEGRLTSVEEPSECSRYYSNFYCAHFDPQITADVQRIPECRNYDHYCESFPDNCDCIRSGDSCSSDDDCCGSLACRSGTCEIEVVCGSEGQTCCAGNSCNGALECRSGRCEVAVVCGSDGQVCCAGNSCNSGFECVSGTCRVEEVCGSEGLACCSRGSACGQGLECKSGTCEVPCGAEDQECCTGGNQCTGDLVCAGSGTGSTCQPCGSGGQVCCGNRTCDEGFDCTGSGTGTCMGNCGSQGQQCCTGTTECGRDLVCEESGEDRTCQSCGEKDQACCATGDECRESGLECVGGVCVEAEACGSEGEVCCSRGDECVSGFECESGVCRVEEDCGSEGQVCCAYDNCASGLECRLGACVVAVCGGEGEVCCSRGDECVSGFECESGVCRVEEDCGSEGQVCCAYDNCASGLECRLGACVVAVCGGEGEVCCRFNECDSEFECLNNRCGVPDNTERVVQGFSFDTLAPGSNTSLVVNESGIPFSLIQFAVSEEVNDVELNVTSRSELPPDVSGSPVGVQPYSYVTISSEDLRNEDVSPVGVEFSVDKSFFSGVSVDYVRVFEYNQVSHAWNKLDDPAYLSEDGDSHYFKVVSDGLVGDFVIALEKFVGCDSFSVAGVGSYDVELVYSWEDSPAVNHKVVGELSAGSFK